MKGSLRGILIDKNDYDTEADSCFELKIDFIFLRCLKGITLQRAQNLVIKIGNGKAIVPFTPAHLSPSHQVQIFGLGRPFSNSNLG